MHFIVLGYDGSDAEAPARRQAARPAHLEAAKQRFAAGEWLFAAAILDDDGQMIGSMIVCDYPSREELDNAWLVSEPYVVGEVWVRIEVQRAAVAPDSLRPPTA